MYQVQAAAEAAKQVIVQARAKGQVLVKHDVLVMTQGINQELAPHYSAELWRCIQRHLRGDWGDVGPDDAEANDVSLADGSRLLSSYRVGGRKIWIITEARVEGYPTATSVLFPEEY